MYVGDYQILEFLAKRGTNEELGIVGAARRRDYIGGCATNYKAEMSGAMPGVIIQRCLSWFFNLKKWEFLSCEVKIFSTQLKTMVNFGKTRLFKLKICKRRYNMIDITLKITPKMVSDAQENEKKSLVGHLGTHFDVMDKEFPLEYTRRDGVVFDVSHVRDRDIEASDVDLHCVGENMFVIFYTGFIERAEYGTREYFTNHPQLSNELIDDLLDLNISMIGVDFAGVRRGKDHTPKDKYCADRGVFIVENLCNLKSVLGKDKIKSCIVNTYPMNYANMTGLPCRVTAERFTQ